MSFPAPQHSAPPKRMLRLAAIIAVAVTVAGAAVAAVSLTSGGGHSRHPRAQAARPVISMTPAPVPSSPDANTVICRKLGRVAPHLENVLMIAAGDPAAVAAAPGARTALRQAAGLLQAWSKTAKDGFDGHEFVTLGFDLDVTADQLRIAAAGMTDPNAATYAADALKGVTKADDDCAVLAHGTS